MEEQKDNQDYVFIKEKIKDKPINKRRLLMKVLWVVISAVIFGFMACVTFVIARPKLEKHFYPPEDSTITIPKDVAPEEDDVPQESGDSDSNNQEPAEPETTPQEPETIYVPEELEVEDYQTLQNKLYAIGKQASAKSVVTVTGVASGVDLFNSSYENPNSGSGIIIANNGQELLIMTEKKVIADAQAIHITFSNDVSVPASLKKYDGNTGIAIISVPLSDIPPTTLERLEAAVLGNSLTVNQGTVVLAIGSPLGSNYSILSGTITSSGNTVSTMDSNYTIFTTDIIGSAQGSGVLLNLNGEVIGVMVQEFSSEGDQNTITALSISELKEIIEKLFNGQDIPYLGLKVSTVTETIAEVHGIPKGVYIKNVAMDSPAMIAGLQENDIIVEIAGEKMKTLEDYTQKIRSLEPGQQVTIKVQRQDVDGYVDVEFSATIGILQ